MKKPCSQRIKRYGLSAKLPPAHPANLYVFNAGIAGILQGKTTNLQVIIPVFLIFRYQFRYIYVRLYLTIFTMK